MAEKGAVIPLGMWRSAILVSLSSLLFGYALASLNSCLVTGDGNSAKACYNGDDDSSPSCPPGSIYDDMNLSLWEAQIATSLTILGAWIGCLNGSAPSEKYGRRPTLLGNNVFYIIGAILAASGVPSLLYVGRLITGLGVGVTSVVAPVLLSEIASEATRGVVTTNHQLMITIGVFSASIVAYGFVGQVNHGWQYVQAFPVLICAIQLICFHFIPESPKWLLQHGKRAEALAILTTLRLEGWDVDEEVCVLEKEATDASVGSGDAEISWAQVFQWKEAVNIGCWLMGIQALTGINSVMFYSTTIFSFAGFDDSILATVSVGLVNVFTTVLSAYLVDKQGRKILLFYGTVVMFFSLVVLSVILLAGDNLGETQGVIAVLAVLIYVFGFSIGLGAVSWVVVSEIMPTKLRTKAFSLFVSINWGGNLLIGLLTLTAIDGLGDVHSGMTDDETSNAEKKGVAYLYLLFALLTLGAVLYIHFKVPETKGKTPEQLRDMAEGKDRNVPFGDNVLEMSIPSSDHTVSPLASS